MPPQVDLPFSHAPARYTAAPERCPGSGFFTCQTDKTRIADAAILSRLIIKIICQAVLTAWK